MNGNQTRLACGHEQPDTNTDTIAVPEVGPMCRSCHTPISMASWPEVLRERTYRTPDGRVHHQTLLLGLDAVGRGVYYDTKARRVRVLVPKHHPDFRMDVEGGEVPVRAYPARHGPARTNPVSGPTNDVLVEVSGTNVRLHTFTTEVEEWVAEHALAEEWQAVHERVLADLETAIDRYSSARYPDDAFPFEEARAILARHGED